MTKRFDRPEGLAHALAERDLPDAGHGICCIGAAHLGPGGCTCWEPVHDQFQAAPDLSSEPTDRDTMCADCAFKPGSPERTGVDAAAYDAGDLDMLVATDAPFWCHQGMRLTTALRHPSGAVKPLPGSLAYDPPIINGVPYQADGTAGQGCAGLAARRRAVKDHPDLG